MLAQLASILAKYLKSLEARLNSLIDRDGLEAYLFHIGWSIQENPEFEYFVSNLQFVNQLSDLINALEEFSLDPRIEGNLDSGILSIIESSNQLIGQLRDIIGFYDDFSVSPFNESVFWNDLFLSILNESFVDYLKTYNPLFFAGLHYIGAICIETHEPVNEKRVNYTQIVIRWEKILQFLKNPSNLLTREYNWGTNDKKFEWEKFLHRLEYALLVNKLLVRYALPRKSVVEAFSDPLFMKEHKLHELSVPLVYGSDLISESFFNFGLGIMPINDDAFQTNCPQGLLITPIVEGDLNQKFSLTGDTKIEFNNSFKIGSNYAIKILPGKVEFLLKNQLENFNPKISLVGEPVESFIFLGSMDSSVVELLGFEFNLHVDGLSDNGEVKIGFRTKNNNQTQKGLHALIQLDEADAFLQETTQSNHIEAWFDTEISWSNKTGFTFGGSFGFDLDIPLHQKLGPIEITRLKFDISEGPKKTSHSSIGINTGLGVKGKLGPLRFEVEEVGFSMNFIPYSHEDLRALPEDADPPLLGLLDLDFGFSPPKGIGLSIDSSSVKGGGYLFFDHEKAQYSGVVQLEINDKFELQAIGLLTTRLPDNRKGYSFLILITAEGFKPIQLGWGFLLQKVGGVLGFNRTVASEALRGDLKAGGLSTILFPSDPLENADKLITDLRRYFPATPDQHLFGPVVEIAWGKPTMLLFQLGFILEFGDSLRLHVLGRINLGLPSLEKALVQIKMDTIGTIDFEKGEIAIDAVLFDSKILWIDISGDMALRIRWNHGRTFILSIGGFNPRFTVPAGFPKLERLTFSLFKEEPTIDPLTGKEVKDDSGKSPSSTRIQFEAYFALTSNTAQVGARFDLYVKTWAFSIEAYLYFNALFEFDPFKFVIDIGGGITLKVWGYTLFSLRLEMTLSGPSPWHVRGSVTIDLWLFEVSKSFDRTLSKGTPPPAPPAINPLPSLIEALENVHNWEARLSEGGRALIGLREMITHEDELLVNPEVPIRVRQTVLPLNTKISRIGNSPLEEERVFELQLFSTDGTAKETGKVKDYFAPAQYREMSKHRKLSSPSFERMDAGLSLGDDAIVFGMDDMPPLDIDYKTMIIGMDGKEPIASGMQSVEAEEVAALATIGASGRSTVRKPKYQGPSIGLKKQQPTYVLTDQESLTGLETEEEIGIQEYLSFVEAEDALNDLLAQGGRQKRKVRVMRRHLVV